MLFTEHRPSTEKAGIALRLAICASVFVGLSALAEEAALGQDTARRQQSQSPVAAVSPFIDVHTHLERAKAVESIALAVRAMPTEHSAKYLFLPSPFDRESSDSFDLELIQTAARGQSENVSALGGGGTLNPMIQQAVNSGETSVALEKAFRLRAEQIAAKGAVGFGELTAEHRPSASTPSYQSAPPDHRLFLLLADLAAEHDLPITLHMEAVPTTMPMPERWRVNGVTDTPQLGANIDAFERLLTHNSRAKVVWAHAGWDNTGFRTPQLMRRLLTAHANLYMELKIDPLDPGLNSPLVAGASGNIKPEWLKLLQDFPDRFVIGSDQHYPTPNNGPQRWQAVILLFNQLPPELRQKIGVENATRIYKLKGK